MPYLSRKLKKSKVQTILDNTTLIFYALFVLNNKAERLWAATYPKHQDSGGFVMTVLTRWDPFREFSTLQHRMNRLFRYSYGDRD